MPRIILLDAGPLGLACIPAGTPAADQCRAWMRAREADGAIVGIPAVADYEVRRELIRLGAMAKLRKLDALVRQLGRIAVSPAAWDRAADFWALVRQAGLPTAGPDELDADAILGGMAATIGRPGDVVTIATTNVRHLRRFPGVDAQHWASIP